MSTRCIERDLDRERERGREKERTRCSIGDGPRRDAMQILASMLPFPSLPPAQPPRHGVPYNRFFSSFFSFSSSSSSSSRYVGTRCDRAFKRIVLMNTGCPRDRCGDNRRTKARFFEANNNVSRILFVEILIHTHTHTLWLLLH